MDLSMGMPSRNVEDRRGQIVELTPWRYALWTKKREPAMTLEEARAQATLGAMMGALHGRNRPEQLPPKQ